MGEVRLYDPEGVLIERKECPLEGTRDASKVMPEQSGAAFAYGHVDSEEGLIVRDYSDGEVIRWAHEDARLNLKPGTPFEIRRGIPTGYGRVKHIG